MKSQSSLDLFFHLQWKAPIESSSMTSLSEGGGNCVEKSAGHDGLSERCGNKSKMLGSFQRNLSLGSRREACCRLYPWIGYGGRSDLRSSLASRGILGKNALHQAPMAFAYSVSEVPAHSCGQSLSSAQVLRKKGVDSVGRFLQDAISFIRLAGGGLGVFHGGLI